MVVPAVYTNTLPRWYVWVRSLDSPIYVLMYLFFFLKQILIRKTERCIWTLNNSPPYIHPRSLASVHNQRFCMIINHGVYIPGGPLAIKAAIHHKQTMAKSSNQTDSCFKASRPHLHFLLPASSLLCDMPASLSPVSSLVNSKRITPLSLTCW